MQTVCLIGTPRTGLHYVSSVLGGFPDVRAYGELFNDNAQMNLDRLELDGLSEVFCKKFENAQDPELKAIAKAAPAKLLDELGRINKDRHDCLVFSLLPRQLDPRTVRSQILTNQNISFFLVKRRLIDCYISLMKSKTVEQVANPVETTRIRVHLDLMDYLQWVAQVSRWYLYCEQVLKAESIPYQVLNYETDVAQLEAALAKTLKERLGRAGIHLAEFDNRDTGLTRQDRARTYEEKVANLDEFLDALREMGIMPEDEGTKERDEQPYQPFEVRH